jgi:hypothetical protein
MTQAGSEPRRFHLPRRWRYAGGDHARSKHVDQRADRSFIRSEGLPKSLFLATTLACATIPRFCRNNVAPTIKVRAGIKSP